MISNAEGKVLEDESRDAAFAILSLLFDYWHLPSALILFRIGNSCTANPTEFKDGEDKSHLPPPEAMVAAEVEDAGGTEDDHLVDGVLLNGMMHLIARTAPVDRCQAVSAEEKSCQHRFVRWKERRNLLLESIEMFFEAVCDFARDLLAGW